MATPDRSRPARIVPLAFLGAIAIGTVALRLPWSARTGERTDVLQAAFTAVSATCVTGLITVDTATHWSVFGQVVILVLIQAGGFGIMTLATLLGVLVTGRLRLEASLVTQVETHTSHLGDVRRVPLRVARVMAVIEAAVAVVLTLRFRGRYDDTWGAAAWHGVFHAVSAFNNAGFALYPDNLGPFVSDPWICLPLCAAVILGGLGFPVFFELRRRWRRPRSWSLHLRLTVWGTVLLLVIGIGAFGGFEWTNPATLGKLGLGGKIVAAITGGVMPRTAGFASVDFAHLDQATYIVQYALMFIGGGSAGTAGGIKITTFLLLAFVIWSELRGQPETDIGHRSVAPAVQRQAMVVALMGIGVVAVGTVIIVLSSPFRLQDVAFEAISAFGTVGLSVGITAKLPVVAQITLMVLMFVGRVGTITVGSALALRRRSHHYHLPEERPIVG